MSGHDQEEATIDALLAEHRTFPPSNELRAAAVLNDPSIYERANADIEAFWAEEAKSLDWYKPWDTVLEWDAPFAKWFNGGQLNVSYNCLDRHVLAGRGDRVAYYWEGEPGDRKTITYQQLLDDVCQTANALKELGVQRGDRVAIYMPMIPELPVAMLACTRIGAAHTVVFGGFSSESLSDRINDARAKVVITADGGFRRGTASGLKVNVDTALETTPTIEHVLVVKRTGQDVTMAEGRDVWWHDIVDHQSKTSEPEHMESEDLLYLLYTSGTTAKPKGIVHTTAGYLLGVSATHRWVFDIKDDDIYWAAADIGWVTGHSYIVYGPLANCTTGVMYEGTPDHPSWERWWEIIERYKVTILYCAPTAIRSHMKQGPQYAAKHDLSSLRLLGSVGEPINPEAWMWYHRYIGAEQCPIVDTWWQTETGCIMISPIPSLTTTKPGSATFPIPGIEADVVDSNGQPCSARAGRLPRHQQAVAIDAARHLWRSRALQSDLLEPLPRSLLPGRRLQAGRGRLLLAARPRRRRDERLRPPAQHDRDRKRAGCARGGRRGGGRRPARQRHRRGDLRVRHSESECRAVAGAWSGTTPVRRQQDRPDRPPEDGDVHA